MTTATSRNATGGATPALSARRLNKSYGTPVLAGLDLDIADGEFVAIMGPSGSGKSTLMHCLSGMDRPDSGTILVGDREVTSLSRKDLGRYRRDLVGFVFQFYNLVPTLTARENVGVCQYLSDDPMPLDDLLADLGLADHRNKFPSQLSGGQQQRCAIARALIKRPRLLLCDEPTGALDYETSKEMLSLLERINRDLGTTIVIVTHNQVLAEMAHRTITVRDGRISDVEVRKDPALASSLTW